MSDSAKERRWTTREMQSDGSYSKVVTEEQWRWLFKQWTDDWMTVAEDLDRWDSPFRSTE